MRIAITIEYDADIAEGMEGEAVAEQERKAFIAGEFELKDLTELAAEVNLVITAKAI